MTLIALYSLANGQNYKLTWGDETSMKRKTVDMHLVNADKTGVYFLEGQVGVKSVWFGGVSTSYKLLKFDNNFEKLYEKDYKKELKDYNFEGVRPLKDKMFLFADDYNKKENIYTIYGVLLDKSSGEMMGDPAELASYTLDNDKDNVDYVIKASGDSSQWIVAASVTAHDQSSSVLYVSVFDDKLKKKTSAVIKYKEAPGTFSFEDIVCTSENKLLVLCRRYEIVPNGKRKTKQVFTNYTLERYSAKGAKEAAYNLDSGEVKKYTIGGKLITLESGNILFAGFYSNTIDKKDLNGIYTCKIDLSSSQLSKPFIQPMNKNMLGAGIDSADIARQAEQADTEDSKKKNDNKKKDDDKDMNENFESSYTIRSVIESPDHESFWIVAESYVYSERTYTYATTDPMTHMTKWYTDTRYSFTNGSVMVINSMLTGEIKKINVIPKLQNEIIYDRSSSGAGFSYHVNYAPSFFVHSGGLPYYSSVASIINQNKLILFFNDHPENAGITDVAGNPKVKTVYYNDFKKSNLYAVSIDLATYKVERKEIFANGGDDDIIAMPRFAYKTANNLYIPSIKRKTIGSTELRIGKITVQ